MTIKWNLESGAGMNEGGEMWTGIVEMRRQDAVA